ncbi:MAG: S-layer homology domain-containing protein, partial [Bradymonadaceae bacterium]
LNSQVWGHGGYQGPGGGQCHTNNYSYPWSDNYCETRSWNVPMCPGGTGHQGQDIRASTCANSTHRVVATVAGTITHIGSYSVSLAAADGTRHRFLHMSNVAVRVGQNVSKGQVIGRVSNQFGGTPTTIHLHYDLYRGGQYIPTYMSLVSSYETLIGSGSSTEPPPPANPPGGCVPTAASGAEQAFFKDLPPSQHGYEQAQMLYRAGITNGCNASPRMFCPNCPVTREQMVAFVVRAAGLNTSNPPARATFSDVPTNSTFYKYVEAAAKAGITQGCGNGKFCPKDNVTRAQSASLIRRAAGWPQAAPSSGATFSDVARNSTHFADVETLKSRCVTNGCGTNKFCPGANLTRAHAAVFIARAFNLENSNTCAVSGGCSGQPQAGAEQAFFKDFTPNQTGYEEAILLHGAGITNGCSQSPRMFCPNCPTSRRHMAMFLVRAVGLDTSNPPARATFSDVPVGASGFAEVEAAAAAGITNGCGNGKFCPNDAINRAQAAAMLRRSMNWPQVRQAQSTFTDVAAGSTFHADIETIADRCVTNGCGADKFCPDRELTRSQAAAFIARGLNLGGINACSRVEPRFVDAPAGAPQPAGGPGGGDGGGVQAANTNNTQVEGAGACAASLADSGRVPGPLTWLGLLAAGIFALGRRRHQS